MTLGENLKRLRTEKGLSQEEVAGQLFLSRQTVSKWENNQAEPGVENLKALAKLYGVTLDQLLGTENGQATFEGAEQGPSQVEQRRDDRDYLIWTGALLAVVVLKSIFTLEVYGNINVPFSLLAMVVGIWVRHPATWVVIQCLFGVNVVLALPGLILGSVLGASDLAINGIYMAVFFLPNIRRRFHVER